MAILTGINTRLHKSAGDWTFMRKKNVTIAVQKVEKKGTPVRTQRQMNRRSFWANPVAMWKSFGGNMKPSFERKATNQSDFNAFMSLNLSRGTRVYLTRGEVMQGACVVADYQVARGTLPPIEVSLLESGRMQTNIALGDDFQITATTTVAEFTQAVLANNDNRFKEGDQIACFLAEQLTSSRDNIPYVKMKTCRVILDSENYAKLFKCVKSECFAAYEGYLASRDAVAGGIAWIHTREVDGKTKVSTQKLAVNNTLLSTYTSAAARSAAITSYGGVNKSDYLTPDETEDEDVNVNP